MFSVEQILHILLFTVWFVKSGVLIKTLESNEWNNDGAGFEAELFRFDYINVLASKFQLSQQLCKYCMSTDLVGLFENVPTADLLPYCQHQVRI